MDIYRFSKGTKFTARLTAQRDIEVLCTPPGKSWPVDRDSTRNAYLQDIPSCIAFCLRHFAASKSVRLVFPVAHGFDAFGELCRRVPFPGQIVDAVAAS